MNIVVLVKQVPDTAVERKLTDADGTLDRASVDGLINELGEYAIEEGLKIAEAQREAGNEAEATILTTGPQKMRPSSVAPEPAPGPTEISPVTVAGQATGSRITGRVVAERGERPDLTEATIVVSGGRGTGGAEGFGVIEQLTDALGAAVGASRAVTDAGWYPHQFQVGQVGQTGKTVSAQLYMAVGISGAIQHRSGTQAPETIAALNKDPEAPIFELADLGVVGDLFEVVSQLLKQIDERKAR